MDNSILRKYDLTSKICQYIDPYLALIVIDFLNDTATLKLYTRESLLKAKYKILSRTSMIDYENGVYKQIHNLPDTVDEPGYAERREVVVKEFIDAVKKAEEHTNMENETGIEQIIEDEKSKISHPVYNLALISYNIGNFTFCEDALNILKKGSETWDNSMNCLWGLLVCGILSGKLGTTTFDVFSLLKDRIEMCQNTSQHLALMRRSWLMHWSLFLFFDKNRSTDGVIDFFMQPQYLNTITTKCPWLLRYPIFAILINSKRTSSMKEIIEIVQDESLVVDDPFVLLIKSLNVNYDFEAVREHFANCISVLQTDYFLHKFDKEFIDCTRILITEMYFQIHHVVDIIDLFKILDIDQTQGQLWITEYINNSTHIDAGIDAVSNFANITFHRKTVYQQILEYTRGLVPRTSVIASTLEKCEQELKERSRIVS